MISTKSQKAIIALRNYISDLDNITNVQQGKSIPTNELNLNRKKN